MFKDELVIIRHGRSGHNIRKSDDLDCCLTDYGHKQSRDVGVFLSKHMDLKGFQFFTSPFLRCLQTVQGINTSLGERWTVNQKLREYVNHSGSDVKVVCRKDEYPHPHYLWGDYPEEGVTYKEEWNEVFIDRITHCFDALPQKSVVVTHGLPAMLLLHVASSLERVIPLWDMSIDNCSITYIVKGRVVWRGRNLYHELEEDPFEKPRLYDFNLKPKD